MKISCTALDKKFSVYIRMRAGYRCERMTKNCSSKMECSHYHGRRKQSVRFDDENCSCLCFVCHRYFTENPSAHTAWMKKKLGEDRYNALLVRANRCGKPDYELLNLALSRKIKELENNQEMVP